MSKPQGKLPPGPRNRLIGTTLFPFRRNPLKFMSSLVERYGDIVYFRSARDNFFVINHPDYIKDLLVTSARKFAKGRALERSRLLLGEGLLTSEGQVHLRQRRLMQPAFHRERIASYAEAMVQYAARLRDRWQDGQQVDIHAQMTALTLAIVGKTLFDADVEHDTSEVVEAITEAFSLFPLTMVPFSNLLEKIPFSPVRKVFRARARLDRIIYRIIDARRQSGEDRGDLLSMLLRAQDVEGDGGGMSNQQLRDECLTLFLAGHETTANALTWTWFLLAQHPAVEQRFHAELDRVLAGRLPDFRDVEALAYTEMIVAEALRMYPPAWIVGRRALEDHQFGPYHIPRRSLVAASQWITHHDARFFPEPFRFDPERWTVENRAARPKFSYFPFSAGPRQCIGEGFAWAEAILVLATLAQRWRMTLVPGQQIDIKPLITLRPNGPVLMTLTPRG
jgi:cytochrome P450